MRFLSAFVLLLLFGACRHDALEQVEPTVVCDTQNVTYTLAIRPLVQTRCALSDCHVPGGDGTGDFTTYPGLRAQVDNGHLLPAVQHSAGAIPMPPDGSMLTECEIQAIVVWVNAGALEN